MSDPIPAQPIPAQPIPAQPIPAQPIPAQPSPPPSEASPPGRGWRLGVGLIVVGLAVRGVVSLVPSEVRTPQVTPQAPPEVRVLRLQAESFVQREERYARLVPVQEWTLALEVGGRLGLRPAQNGQECQPGALLLALDPEAFEAEVAVAEAHLSEAQASARLSKTQLERVEALADSTATEGEVDAARAQRDQSQARLAGAQAALNQARYRLRHASLQAPAKGVVSQLSIEPGAFVAAGQVLGRFARRDLLLAKVLVSAEVRRGLEVGQPASLVDDEERVFPARLVRAAPVPSGASGQFEVEFEVDNAAGELFPGEPVRVRFLHGGARQRLRVPRAAVYEEYGLWRVLVPPPERGAGPFRAGSRAVALGPADALAGWVTIHSGLEAGSEILVPERVAVVREGQKVQAGTPASGWLPPYAE